MEKSVYSNNSELITWLRSHQDKPIDVKELLVTAAAWPRFAHSLYRGPCSQNIALGSEIQQWQNTKVLHTVWNQGRSLCPPGLERNWDQVACVERLPQAGRDTGWLTSGPR